MTKHPVACDGKSDGTPNSGVSGDMRDTGGTLDARATLEAWHTNGANTLDAIGFHVMTALARRIDEHQGAAKQQIESRLDALVQAYQHRLAAAKCADTTPAVQSTARPLSTLLTHINGAVRTREAYPELPMLDEAKRTWIRLSTNRQLQHAEKQIPENAGPLHSSRLVTQSLALMRELSPGYLHKFMAYVDALSWTEEIMNAGNRHQESARASGTKSGAKGTPKGDTKIPAKATTKAATRKNTASKSS